MEDWLLFTSFICNLGMWRFEFWQVEVSLRYMADKQMAVGWWAERADENRENRAVTGRGAAKNCTQEAKLKRAKRFVVS